MKLDLEKFKLIPSTYNGIDFMKYNMKTKISFSISYDRLNAKQVKANEFLKEEKIESMFDEED